MTTSSVIEIVAIFDNLSIYLVSYDRAGYGESDPNPLRGIKSEAEDIARLADLLELGSMFYLLTDSIGAHVGWSCIKYIPHRLAGVGMIVPVVNYWWKCIDNQSFKLAFQTQTLKDKVFMWIVRHLPQLIYFYITQWWIPKPTPLNLFFNLKNLNSMDRQVLNSMDQVLTPEMIAEMLQGTQQGVGESFCRDLMSMFGDWEFDPSEIEDPFVTQAGSVHIWQGEEDYLVRKEAQSVIHQKAPWIKYHSVKGGRHSLSAQPGFIDSALKALLLGESFDFQVAQPDHQ
ncbi:hypothetical protein KP509_09G041400 [Ceratopteris richardii]|uniref:AB hydrolase-1 domain-containing protein n=1 Tax=Ceratopteris richardii TaxID=49495 RepID=A0A8T2U6B4_CERRI|nr:hypothetical protein KP509_09G041400 [Ceratopteris richardii]